VGDIPAASHPPLAACLARLAGRVEGDIVWDPFCGSGLELIERALQGGVARCIGTDLSEDALATARANLDSAVKDTSATLVCCDFRDHSTVPDLRPGTVSLVVSNPPLGRRVPIPDLSGLIADFFAASSSVLRKGGRLVFVNPVSVQPRGLPLRLDRQQKIDLGGFHCRLEKYTKI
jgi:tRNA G10  N-methylase Trm11